MTLVRLIPVATLALALAPLDLAAALFAFGEALAGTAKSREEMITNANKVERVLSFGRATDVIMVLPS